MATAIVTWAQAQSGFILLVVAILGFFSQHEAAKWAVVAGCAQYSMSLVMDAALRFFMDGPNPFGVLLAAACSFVFSLCFALYDSLLLAWFLPCLSAYSLGFGIYMYLREVRSEWLSFVVVAGICAVLQLIALVARSCAASRSQAVTAEDVKAYNDAWGSLWKQQREELDSLADACAKVDSTIQQRGEVLQQRLKPDGCPVWDLGQLLYQAEVVDALFGDKARAWAAQSAGSYGDVHVKPGRRAMAKALEAYVGDTSQLLDLSRKSISFDKLEQLQHCVMLLYDDKDIVCERIKNRLSPRYDSTVSDGYRDVFLNFRFVTAAAQGLGVNAHIVELQLMLNTFARLKNTDSDRRYKSFGTHAASEA